MRVKVLAVSSVMLMSAATASPSLASNIKHVFVIAFENKNAEVIYRGSPRTPYINSLRKDFASAGAFADELPDLDSEPHYIWMEAGTNDFSPEHVFKTDGDPSRTNSTASHDHLAAQIQAASGRVSWMTYQESVRLGVCPTKSEGRYAAKHNPFVFFQDVSGNPPKSNTQFCIDHTRPFSDLTGDLKSGGIANYVFITPDLCNDMHGMWDRRRRPICPDHDLIRSGDKWLAKNLPDIIKWASANSSVIFLTWDENAGGHAPIAFLAIGPGVKPGYVGLARYDHGSLVKTVEEIFELPILPKVALDSDLSDLFRPAEFP